jgi:2-methylcitrate dehydratase PrpD
MSILVEPTGGVSMTHRLLSLIDERPITSSDLDRAALFLLDSVACIIGARNSPLAAPILQWAASEPITAARTALVFGALSNILEMDAMHMRSAVHPGTVVVPAALSIELQRSQDTKPLLAAVLRGVEAVARIGRACGPAHAKSFQATATCGGFGAAVAASHLLALDRKQAADAIGTAGTCSGGLWEFLSDGSMSKQWHAGCAAQAGVSAAQLAAVGFTGPQQILEGGRGFFATMCGGNADEAVLLSAEDEWALARISYKPWPSPRPTHAGIEAALEAANQLAQREIREVEIDTYEVAVNLCNHQHVASDHDARFSFAYCVAAALSDKRVDFQSFGEVARARIVPLSKLVKVRATKEFSDAFPEASGAEVRVHLMSGDTLTCRAAHAKGDPQNPMKQSELVEKAMMLLELGQVRDPAEFIQAVLAVAQGGTFPTNELVKTLAWGKEG